VLVIINNDLKEICVNKCDGIQLQNFTETWVVVNKTAPYQINLRILYLEGVLEFFDAPGANYVLEADIIFITCGGRLLIGWPDNPFDGLATIILNGNHSSPNFDIVGDGPVLGSKAIGKDMITTDLGRQRNMRKCAMFIP
jgi:hypothetical protein